MILYYFIGIQSPHHSTKYSKKTKMMNTKKKTSYNTAEQIGDNDISFIGKEYQNIDHDHNYTTMKFEDIKLQQSLHNKAIPYVNLCRMPHDMYSDCHHAKNTHDQKSSIVEDKLSSNDEIITASNMSMDNIYVDDDTKSYDHNDVISYEDVNSDSVETTHEEILKLQNDDLSSTEYDDDPSVEHILGNIMPEISPLSLYAQYHGKGSIEDIFAESLEDIFAETNSDAEWEERMEAYNDMLEAEAKSENRMDEHAEDNENINISTPKMQNAKMHEGIDIIKIYIIRQIYSK